MKYIVLEKIKDKVYDNDHPNGVNVGSTVVRGLAIDPIVIGKQFLLYNNVGMPFSWTSKVLSFTDTIIETKNSTYKIHYMKKCNGCNTLIYKTVVVAEEHCCPHCLSTDIKILEK